LRRDVEWPDAAGLVKAITAAAVRTRLVCDELGRRDDIAERAFPPAFFVSRDSDS